MEIITIINEKGGVGKTTTAYNLAYNLNALHGKRVLMIDLDPQSNMSLLSGVDLLDLNCSLYDVFKYKKDINKAVINLKNGLDIIVGSLDLITADVDFNNSYTMLDSALKNLKQDYDFVIIDSPPHLGILCNNALTCSDKVIIPMQASIFSLQGLAQLAGIIDSVKKELNSKLVIDGILITKASLNTNVYKELREQFISFADTIGTKVYKTAIRSTSKVEESALVCESLLHFRPNATATKDYIDFTNEFLN